MYVQVLRTLSSLLVEDLHCSRYDDISLIAILLPADFLSLTCIILLIVQTTECPCDDDLHIGQFQNLFCNDISSAYRKPPELTRMLWQELLDNISYGNNVFTSTVLGTHPLSTVLYLYSYRYLQSTYLYCTRQSSTSTVHVLQYLYRKALRTCLSQLNQYTP